jgi:hypothetical protein
MSEITEEARITELLRQNHLAISVPEYLRTMACVHLETGRRVLPRYVDDEVFRYAADEIERLESALWAKGAEILALTAALQAAEAQPVDAPDEFNEDGSPTYATVKARVRAMLRRNEDYYKRWLANDGPDEAVPLAPTPSHSLEEARKYQIGDRVCKPKGSSWQGIVVGYYSTKLTPIGYCVESEREPGSVQIYPEAALSRLSPSNSGDGE